MFEIVSSMDTKNVYWQSVDSSPDGKLSQPFGLIKITPVSREEPNDTSEPRKNSCSIFSLETKAPTQVTQHGLKMKLKPPSAPHYGGS